jgi:hypothetical protein
VKVPEASLNFSEKFSADFFWQKSLLCDVQVHQGRGLFNIDLVLHIAFWPRGALRQCFAPATALGTLRPRWELMVSQISCWCTAGCGSGQDFPF